MRNGSLASSCGATQPTYVATVNNLGVLYKTQGRLSDAETMYLRALAGQEKALGEEHSSTVTTVSNVGDLYACQGRLSDAVSMYLRALAGQEKALGEELFHPHDR